MILACSLTFFVEQRRPTIKEFSVEGCVRAGRIGARRYMRPGKLVYSGVPCKKTHVTISDRTARFK